MTPTELTQWRESFSLNRTNAAEYLGVTRRTLFAYERGERKIPKPVELACKGMKE